jgi:hypothetical protein
MRSQQEVSSRSEVGRHRAAANYKNAQVNAVEHRTESAPRGGGLA